MQFKRNNIPATQKQIAELLSVSVSTVSLALRNSPKIKKATRERVVNLAQRLGYRPCEIARSLVAKQTRTVGVILPDIAHSFAAELAEAIQRHLRTKDYLGLILSPKGGVEQQDCIETILRRRTDGLIATRLSEEGLLAVKQAGVPTVLFNASSPELDMDIVRTDALQGATLMMEHLISLGYKRLAFLCLANKNEGRYIGFIEALNRHRLVVKPEWIIVGLGYHKTGYEGMQRLLALPERPEAVLAMNDLAAIGAMKAVKDKGLTVPDDIAVVGYDNVVESEYAGLTTVDQPKDEIARSLTEVLLERIEKQDLQSNPRKHIVIPARLVLRESCGRLIRR